MDDGTDVFSDSDNEISDAYSISLPSLSPSVQQQFLNTGKQQMTVKEVDEKVAALRRENFNLKLRLYFIEKEKNGVTKPEYESVASREMTKRDETIRAFQKMIVDKDEEIDNLKKSFDEELKMKNMEIEILKCEKEHVLSDLKVNASVCKSLVAQLEKMKNRKENMEKAITRQLIKTEKLLDKANIDLTDDVSKHQEK